MKSSGKHLRLRFAARLSALVSEGSKLFYEVLQVNPGLFQDAPQGARLNFSMHGNNTSAGAVRRFPA